MHRQTFDRSLVITDVGSGLMAADVPSGPSWVSVWTKVRTLNISSSNFHWPVHLCAFLTIKWRKSWTKGGPELIRQADDTTKPVARGYTGDR